MNKAKQWCVILAIFLIFLLYYNHIHNPSRGFRHILGKTLKLSRTKYKGRYLIKTPGCSIPDYSDELIYKNITAVSSCGERAVFVKKLSISKLQFEIDKTKMKKYVSVKEKYTCCYQTVNRSRISRGEDSFISYSPCVTFKSGTTIKFYYEVIKVTCTVHFKNKTDAMIYDDVYINLRKIKLSKIKTKAWNVLLLGIDSMSRTRFLKTMPLSSRFIKQNGWLDYKGYHATSIESFTNLMAILTGQNKTTIYKKCEYGLDLCVNETLWTNFKDAGYVTAYGEDFIHSESSTFSNYYGFTATPTDHYMKSLFLTAESREDNILCTKKLPSISHLLDYSYQFVDGYKRDNFFGLFWHHTYKNTGIAPSFIDNTFAGFFERLNKTSILDNTFIFFVSNHGITRGDFRIQAASHYEERLPMLYIWVPYKFRILNKNKYKNMQTNQNHLASPYDVFITLSNVLKLSTKSTKPIRSDACPNCMGFFEESSVYRSCASAALDERLCICHDMIEVDQEEGREVLNTAVSYIKSLTIKIDTIPFSICAKLELDKVLRINAYTSRDDQYFIVAFSMMPGNNTFETILKKNGKRYQVLPPIEGISTYNARGSCVIDTNDRPYCICEMTSPCENIF